MDESYLRKARGGILQFPSFALVELDRLCRLLEIPRGTATRFCKVLGIPLIHIGAQTYYNESTLERIIFVLSRVGGPGFASPGSRFKAAGKKGIPTELTEDLQKQCKDASILMEMTAAQGRNIGGAGKVAELIKKMETKRELAKSITKDEH